MGPKIKGRPGFWVYVHDTIATRITGGAGRGGSGSHQRFRVIPGSAAKLPEERRARVAASGSGLKRGVKRGHGQRWSDGTEQRSQLGRQEGKEEEGADRWGRGVRERERARGVRKARGVAGLA
jgi:hypothetical protein